MGARRDQTSDGGYRRGKPQGDKNVVQIRTDDRQLVRALQRSHMSSRLTTPARKEPSGIH